MAFSVVDQLFPKKRKERFFPDKVDMGRGGGVVGVRVRVRIGVLSSVLGIFRNVPSHNTGTTRGPHQIPRFLYFILDNNPFVR